jgi:hypothetical protein
MLIASRNLTNTERLQYRQHGGRYLVGRRKAHLGQVRVGLMLLIAIMNSLDPITAMSFHKLTLEVRFASKNHSENC